MYNHYAHKIEGIINYEQHIRHNKRQSQTDYR